MTDGFGRLAASVRVCPPAKPMSGNQKSAHGGSSPQVICRSSHCRYTLVWPLRIHRLFETAKNAVIVVAGGRNNRDLVTAEKYLRGIHSIQQAAKLGVLREEEDE